MAQNNTQRGLEGFLNATDDELFRRQEKNGHAIYRTAWAVEILAALAGLYFATIMAVQAYDVLPKLDKDIWAIFRVIGGVLPFVIIAIIEPTKIFLASGLYYAKPILWKMVFGFGLLVLTFVTFETIYNGLVLQNVNVNFEIEHLQNERSKIEEEIGGISTKVTEYQKQTDEGIGEKYNALIKTQTSLYETKKNTLETAYQQQLDTIGKEEKEIRAKTLPSREKINDDVSDIQKLINESKKDFKELIVVQTVELREAEKRYFSGTQKEEIKVKIKGLEERGAQEVADLKRQRQQLLADKRNLGLNDDKANNRLKELVDKRTQLNDKHQKNLEVARDEFSTAENSLVQKKNEDIKTVTTNRDEIPSLETEKESLIKEDSNLKADYRKKASRLQVIQLSKMVCGTFYHWCFENTPHEDNKAVKFDIADLPEEKVAMISAIWFTSIAAIVSTIGALLALASFVLRDPKAYKTETNKTFRELVENIGAGFKNIGAGLKTLLERLAGGIGYILESIGGFFKIIARSFRKLTLDIRRYLRTPKIKFEKIEVERIVEKRIEVPVEKIVFKEVPKEIIKRVIVHVPLFSTETGKVEVGEDFVGDWLDKNKQEKED